MAGGSSREPGGRDRFCRVIPGSSLKVLMVTGLLLMMVVEVVSVLAEEEVLERLLRMLEVGKAPGVLRSCTTSGSQETRETPRGGGAVGARQAWGWPYFLVTGFKRQVHVKVNLFVKSV